MPTPKKMIPSDLRGIMSAWYLGNEPDPVNSREAKAKSEYEKELRKIREKRNLKQSKK